MNIELLEKIESPSDLKVLSIDELNELSEQIRQLLIKKVNTTGGHLGPNLGFVEPTIALHMVFDCPKDRIVFDVSHQCYTHKILTGRKEGFTDPDKYLKYSGYTNPNESIYDCFVVGHTSTSVSLATGLAKSRDLQCNGSYNVIAVIGDGSLSGGQAYEGLNNAALLGSNIIIVVNDNDMSIAVNQGGLYSNLKELRETKGKSNCNFFRSLGFDYYYVENGNNIKDLIEVFSKVKDIGHPTVVHLNTLKGKGLKLAEDNKEIFHWILPGGVDSNGRVDIVSPNYNTITTEYILQKVKKDKSVIAVSAATPGATGFYQDFREKLGKNYSDVGIAEEHAIGYISAMAKNGAKPILAILSSFIQRTYDQLSQDLALNNSPATILVYGGFISGADMTHLGIFDIPLICNIPNIVYLAPTNKEEYLSMLDWSVEQKDHPVAIRVPKKLITTRQQDRTDYSKLNRFKLVEKGERIAIIGLGNFYELGCEVKDYIRDELGIKSTLINPKFISGIDKELLESLKSDHDVVITLEDGILCGGFGEKIARFYGNSKMKVLNFGADKEFVDKVAVEELYKRYHLTKELIVEDIKDLIEGRVEGVKV